MLKQPSDRSLRICFVALSAYPLLSGKNCERIVGPDVYQVLLAKELVKRNFEVSFITYDEGGPLVECVDGIKVIKTYSRLSRSNLALRAFSVWRALSKAGAHVYFQQGGAGGITPLFCRLNRKRSVIAIGSDAYVRKEFKDWGILFRLSSKLEIRLADIIAVQTEFQKAMLKRNFGKESVLIRNPFPLTYPQMPRKARPPIVLWVGSVGSPNKQTDLFVRLVTLIPEAKFQIIGGVADRNYYEEVKGITLNTPNLELLGSIPLHEINQYFRRAAILVNTSKIEGFPNAFIQAWMNYTPVVSLNANPDEIICRYKLGFHSRTFNQLVEDVKTLLKDEQLRKEMGENGRRYVEKEHDITKIVDEYIEVFSHL